MALPMRTLEAYIDSLLEYHRLKGEDGTGYSPFAEDWQPTFSLVEPGAEVDPSARVHDSVVLGGGTVGAGAALVRSVVCPGGVVGRRQMVVGQLVRRRSRVGPVKGVTG